MKLSLIYPIIAALALSSCDEVNEVADKARKAQELLQKGSELVQRGSDLQKQAQDLQSSLAAKDYGQAGEIAAKMDSFSKSRVLSWSVKVIAAGEKQGMAGAQALITELRSTSGISELEKTALGKLETAFHGGEVKSMELITGLCALILEHQYGGGAAESEK